MFRDRIDAGRRLGRALARLGLERPVVYGLPRGGVPVAAEVARLLQAPLDIVLVRKIGVPGQEELALGAVVDGPEPVIVWNDDIVQSAGVTGDALQALADRQVAEIARRRVLYGRDHAPVPPAGRTAVLVDDGLATGATARAALRALRRQGASAVVLAAPVAPPETIAALEPDVDRIVVLETPDWFPGVGAFYADFGQTSDEEVMDILREASGRSSEPAAAAGQSQEKPS